MSEYPLPDMTLVPIGWVVSPVTDLDHAARQGDEGAPTCSIMLQTPLLPAAADLQRGQPLIVLTWLHRAARDVLQVHPRGDAQRPLCGVFSTRSADRPNPIGLHTVQVLDIDQAILRVDGLEAIDGTPVIDIKPVLGPPSNR